LIATQIRIVSGEVTELVVTDDTLRGVQTSDDLSVVHRMALR
jgi:hypothetical protein